MLVRVLGAVELVAADGSPVTLPGHRQAALLAALAARSRQVVSADRLIALLWGDDLPENPEAALHSIVFKVRASLRAAGDREVLLTRDGGYQLALRPGDLDADEFTELVERARRLPPQEAESALAQALGLWRGPAYGGFSDTEVAHLEAMALEEARRAAAERRAEALLACGRAAEAVPSLERFVVEHPLREGARVTLMRALHATGRTAEALDQYQRYRRDLAAELGLEPSREMQAVQVALLQQPAPAEPAGVEGTSQHRPTRGLRALHARYLRTAADSVVAYGTAGGGPPLVVLLGWVSGLDVIASGRDPRSSLLERLTDDLAVALYDRAGTGLSPGPVNDYGLEASVEELAEVILAVGPPVALMAMSAAGPIALTMAARRPEWVRSLVLFGTFSNATTTFTDKGLRDMVVEIARSHWGMGSKMLADLYRPGSGDQAASHLARVFRDSSSPEVAAEYLSAMFDYHVDELLPSVSAPALVVHYRGDRLIRFRGAQDLVAGLPNATLVPLDGSVHLPDAVDLDHIERAIVQRHAVSTPTAS